MLNTAKSVFTNKCNESMSLKVKMTAVAIVYIFWLVLLCRDFTLLDLLTLFPFLNQFQRNLFVMHMGGTVTAGAGYFTHFIFSKWFLNFNVVFHHFCFLNQVIDHMKRKRCVRLTLMYFFIWSSLICVSTKLMSLWCLLLILSSYSLLVLSVSVTSIILSQATSVPSSSPQTI